MEEMVDAISRAVRSLSCPRQYPDKIIIGEDAFNEVVAQMKKRWMEGLRVNLKGQYTSLFGMRIEIDKENKNRIDFEKDGRIISASVLEPYEWFAKEVHEKKFYRYSDGFFSYFVKNETGQVLSEDSVKSRAIDKGIDDTLNFFIKSEGDFPEHILDMRLENLYCKHVLRHPVDGWMSVGAGRVLEESLKIGYDFCEWGVHSRHPSDLQYHLGKIYQMIDTDYNHAIRIVICKYDFREEPVFWADNLHSAIKYIGQYGKDVKLRDVPFYVVDLTDYNKPSIYGRNGSLRENYEDILGAISCSYKRFRRSNSQELIDVGYTLKDFLDDVPEIFASVKAYQETTGANDFVPNKVLEQTDPEEQGARLRRISRGR